MEAIANFVIRRRVPIMVLSALITVAAAALTLRLEVDVDFINYLSPTDPVIVRSREVGNTFNSNYTAIVLIESEDSFAPEILRGVHRLTRALEDQPGVASVVSLTNVVDVKKTDSGLAVADLFPGVAVLDDPAALAGLRRYTLGKPTYVNFLVSPDGRFAAIYVNIAEGARKDVVASLVRAVTEQTWPAAGRPAKISYAGQPMLFDYLNHIVVRDMAVLVPLVLGLLVVILFLSFRTLRGVVLPLVTVLMATAVTFGVMGTTGAPLTLIAAIMPVVLISNGSAYGIHVLNFISLSYDRAADSAGAVRAALRLVAVPVVLSAVTTFIGFISFVAGLLTIFESFGIYTAVGITASLFFALTFIPAVASGLKRPRAGARDTGQSAAAASFLSRPLAALARFLHERRRPAFAATVVLVLALVPGIFLVESDFDFLGFFAEESEPRRADAVMTEEFGGTMTYQVHLRGPVKDPLVMGEVYRAHKHLRQTLHSPLVSSIADVIADMNESLNGQRAIPATRAGVESLYLLMEGRAQLNQLVTPAADQALVIGRLPETSNAVTRQTVAAMQRLVEKKLRAELVALPLVEVAPERKGELVELVVGELCDDIAADLAHAGRTLADTAALRSLLGAAVGRDANVAALALDDRRRIIAAYLVAEDCDLVITRQAQREVLADGLAALVDPTAAALARRLAELAPELAGDAEGVELAAAAMRRLLVEEAARREHDGLLAAILRASTPPGEATGLLASELLGELGRLSAGSWPVSPARYASLTGTAPDPTAVVSITAVPAGHSIVMTTILDRIVGSQIYSLALCLVLVLVVMIIQLRSIGGGIIAMVPIAFTLTLNFGLMGYLGITLNVVTALIASLAIGIGIDYTIHTAYRIRTEAAAGGTAGEVLGRVFLSTGRAVLINASAVMAGFLVIVASEISALRVFGWLSALSIGVSAVGALTIYPVLIMILDPRYITPAASAGSATSGPSTGERP